MRNKKTVLVVEDDNTINQMITEYFQGKGFCVVQAFSGTEGRLLFQQEKILCVILDLMLPGISGEDFIREIKSSSTVPIIVVSAKDNVETKINALMLGADDYLAKPFNLEELVLRANKNIEKYCQIVTKTQPEVLYHKNLTLDLAQRKVQLKENELHLTAKEFDILALLLQSPKQIFTKEQIFQSVWGDNFLLDTNTVAVHLSNLRGKLAAVDPSNEYLETVWGIGFKLA